MENQIKEILKKYISQIYGIELKEINLEKPPKPELGDYAFGAFILARDLKKNPAMIASELIKISELEDLIDEANSVGPYLNIKIKKSIYSDIFADIYRQKKIYGNIYNNEDKTIFVDYIGANTGKPLHIGHMCTPNQGQAMINLYANKMGFNVVADSHTGDWGIIFGKLITAYKLWGDKDELQKNAIDYLLQLYIKISDETSKNEDLEQKTRDEFKLLADGDTKNIELWKLFVAYSNRELEKQLARINVFDKTWNPRANVDYIHLGESFYADIMPKVVQELVEKGVATKNKDGSVGVDFGENSKLPSTIIQKRDGTPLYLTSDLAAIKYRLNTYKNLQKIIYFVDIRQQNHMKQAFEIAFRAGWIKDIPELIHAYNGFISLKDGAMSTRKGRIIKLDSLMDEAELRAKKIILEKRDDIGGEELDNLAKKISLGAIKYGYLKKSRETDVVFDWDEFMTFEGNSGPYIQYAYVRANKLLNDTSIDLGVISNYIFEKKEEIELIKSFQDYPKIIQETANKNSPHILAGYAYTLTKVFNSFYNNVRISQEKDSDTIIGMLKLVEMFKIIIKDVFSILGIEMPDKM